MDTESKVKKQSTLDRLFSKMRDGEPTEREIQQYTNALIKEIGNVLSRWKRGTVSRLKDYGLERWTGKQADAAAKKAIENVKCGKAWNFENDFLDDLEAEAIRLTKEAGKLEKEAKAAAEAARHGVPVPPEKTKRAEDLRRQYRKSALKANTLYTWFYYLIDVPRTLTYTMNGQQRPGTSRIRRILTQGRFGQYVGLLAMNYPNEYKRVLDAVSLWERGKNDSDARPKVPTSQGAWVPRNDVILTDRANNALATNGLDRQAIISEGGMLINSKGPDKRPLNTVFLIDTGKDGFVMPTEDDFVVLRAVSAIVDDALQHRIKRITSEEPLEITLALIIRTIKGHRYGRTNNPYTPNEKKRVLDSLMRLGSTWAMVFCADEIDAWNESPRFDWSKGDPKAEKIELEQLLNFTGTFTNVNGQAADTIKIKSVPLTYRYAVDTNNMRRIDRRYKPRPNRATLKGLTLNDYLWNRIGMMYKNPKKTKHTIVFDTIVSALELDVSTPKKFRHLHSQILAFLDAAKAPDDVQHDHLQLIDGYDVIKDGNRIIKYAIYLKKERPSCFEDEERRRCVKRM